MSIVLKTLSGLVAAALLAASPIAATAAAAHPSGSHRSSHGSSHAPVHGSGKHGSHVNRGHHKHAKPVDHLAGQRRGATHEINAELKAVQALATRAAGLTIPDAAALHDALAADAQALQADLAAVSTAGSKHDLRTLRSSAGVTRQTARVQYHVVVASDAKSADANSLSAIIAALMGQLADQPGSAAIEQALGTLEADAAALANVGTDLANVVTDILALPATGSRADLHTAQHAAEQALEAADATIEQVAADVSSVQQQFGL
ncbi:MAG TPA: hypothetical protein VKB75_16640 [Jatrophihabitans sp.]|nr:hypothetical protein [Jatrophihabitans sp.]